MDLREIIAANISSLRNERKITQIKLAEVLNYSDKAVSKWERGESIPDISVLKQIADYFGVTVDYLLTEVHTENARKSDNRTKEADRNHLIISLLGVLLVWLIGTFIFVEINILNRTGFPAWLSFIYSIPVSFTLGVIFNSIWGKARLNFILISGLVWSLLLSVFLSFITIADINLWIVFILGIPAQFIIILWSGLKKS